jgi:hypothetical protein
MVVGVVSAIAMFVYHRFTSKKTQDKVGEAISAGESVARAIVATMGGRTVDEVATAIRAAVKVQLAHVGLDPEALPPAVQGLLDAVEARVLVAWRAFAIDPQKTP